jgi:HAD superfamily phosphatase (TIGR01668 family)
VDNTLVPHGEPADERAKALFAHLKELGYSCMLLSNNKEPRVKMFNDVVQVNYIYKANKPMPGNYRKAMEIMGTTTENTLFVGDQIFTDTLGANCAGCTSILVKAIDNHNIWLKLRHVAEKPFIFLARKRRIQYD